jgi:glycosyltransferase involved in cell wall biosynthesis
MLEAFGRLVSGWSGSTHPALVVVGEGGLRPALERRARELGVTDDVHWLGWRDDVTRFLAGFDLFTLASRSEGTSISLLEAMAAGLCPVVTDVGGNSAVLGTDLAHRLAPAEDPGALAAAWEAALMDPLARARDAAVAAQRVKDAYSLDGMVRAYEALYTSLVGGST